MCIPQHKMWVHTNTHRHNQRSILWSALNFGWCGRQRTTNLTQTNKRKYALKRCIFAFVFSLHACGSDVWALRPTHACDCRFPRARADPKCDRANFNLIFHVLFLRAATQIAAQTHDAREKYRNKKTQQICYLLSEVNWLVVWMPHNTRFHCIFRHGKSKFYTSQKTTIAQKAVRMCVYSSFVAYSVSEPVAWATAQHQQWVN